MVIASASSLNFGSVLVGASSSLSFTLTNSGTDTVDVSSVTSTSAMFTVGTNCGELRSKHACTITVTFRPTTIGASGADLQIFYHPNASLLRMPVSGVGIVVKHKENKETKEAVVEKTADRKPIEVKGVASERLAQHSPLPPEGELPSAKADSNDAVQHAFITPQERPSLDTQQPEISNDVDESSQHS